MKKYTILLTAPVEPVQVHAENKEEAIRLAKEFYLGEIITRIEKKDKDYENRN